MNYPKNKEKNNNIILRTVVYFLAMMFVLLVCTFVAIVLLGEYGITKFSTEYLTSLNLTLVTMIFALNTLPSYIQKKDYESANLDVLISKEKQETVVDVVTVIFTVLSVVTTSVCVAKPLSQMSVAKQNDTLVNWYEECPTLIVNLVAYSIVIGLPIVFSQNRDTPISSFIQQVQRLKILISSDASERKKCWLDDMLIVLLVVPTFLFAAMSTSFLGLSLLFTIFISASLFLHALFEILILGTRRRISCSEIIVQVFILLIFGLCLAAVLAYSRTILQLAYCLYLLIMAFCVFVLIPFRSNGYIRDKIYNILLKMTLNSTRKQVAALKIQLDDELNPRLSQLINTRLDISHTDYSLDSRFDSIIFETIPIRNSITN